MRNPGLRLSQPTPDFAALHAGYRLIRAPADAGSACLRRDRLRRRQDAVGVDAVVAVEVGDRAGLAEMLDAERPRAVAVHGAEPAERRRVAVDAR